MAQPRRLSEGDGHRLSSAKDGAWASQLEAARANAPTCVVLSLPHPLCVPGASPSRLRNPRAVQSSCVFLWGDAEPGKRGCAECWPWGLFPELCLPLAETQTSGVLSFHPSSFPAFSSFDLKPSLSEITVFSLFLVTVN